MKFRSKFLKINRIGRNLKFCRIFLISFLFFLIFFFRKGLALDITLIAEVVILDTLFLKLYKKKTSNINFKSYLKQRNNLNDVIELSKLSTEVSDLSNKQSKLIKGTSEERKERKIRLKKNKKGYGWKIILLIVVVLILTCFHEKWIIFITNFKYTSNEQKIFNSEKCIRKKYNSYVFNFEPPVNLSIIEFSDWLVSSWVYRTNSHLPFWDSRNNLKYKKKSIEYFEIEFDTFIELEKSNYNLSNLYSVTKTSDFKNQQLHYDNIANNTNFTKDDEISIVIPAYNEEEFIAKTIIYTIEATPKVLLREIIVVDDSSQIPVIQVLEKELPDHYKEYVRVIRLKKTEGLIRSRIVGADAAFGRNIFFLDGHCRPKKGWSEALVKSIKKNYKRIVCPIVQSISSYDWNDIGTAGAKMMIEWNFAFHWYDDGLPEVPITSGGILMITKRWWEESGKYDPGMLFWGGENIEQSFRVWLCGGEIHVVRDSLVGHIFERKNLDERNNNFIYKKTLIDNMNINHQRTAFVWLSEKYYETYFKNFHVMSYLSVNNTKGLSERLAIKHNLNCKPFEWYIKKFRPAFERQGALYYSFHHIQHLKSRLCLSIDRKQVDMLNNNLENSIEIPLTVIPNDVSKYNKKSTIEYNILTLEPCNISDESQKWSFVLGNRMMYNQLTKRCLDRIKSIQNLNLLRKENSTENVEKNRYGKFLHVPLLYECDWNLVMRARNMNQFWAWKHESNGNGRIVSWDGEDHKSNATGGAEDFLVPQDKGVGSDSYCLFSNATLGDYGIHNLYYKDCSANKDLEEFVFKKLWKHNLFN